ncbi:MAG: polymer-forming cytoskeletal protein [Gammaproteobacteria bacterium]|nr:polymer-forming cytoskeletal protein [Gammaproteobacteria bacterium]
MWGRRRKIRSNRIDTLIGRKSELRGDIQFAGGLHIEGTVRGNVSAPEDERAILTVSDGGTIEGEVRVPNIVLNGYVAGDVYAQEHIELAANARVTGNVYYHLLEMAMGAEVNGSLVHLEEGEAAQLQLAHETPMKPSLEATE